MQRYLVLLYAFVCYVAFCAVFIYLLGFLTGIGVPKSVNSGPAGDTGTSFLVNIALIFAFGFFHSLMAQHRFKALWTRIIPASAERSTYVLQASLFLGFLMWQWQPLPTQLWSLDGAAAGAMQAVFLLGAVVVLISTFLIDHFELFGLRQSWCNFFDKPMPAPVFRTPLLYRIVRHPMQFGLLILFWAAPVLTAGHLLLASGMTAYMLIGLHLEERALLRQFPGSYHRYRQQVSMLIPFWPTRRVDLSLQNQRH